MKPFFERLLSKFKLMDRGTRVILILFILLSFITAFLAYNFVRNFTTSMTILNLPGAPLVDQSMTGSNGTAPLAQADLEKSTAEPWNGVSRVTLLIMGVDYRDWEKKETPRSDTMILLTLDPVTKTAGMLSIPRDLWVNIPNYGYHKINEAYFLGESNRLPGGGPQLASDTVEQLLGVPINYFAQVDFSAFIKLIDIIGGVPVTTTEDVIIQVYRNPEPPYNITLKSGQIYTLDGNLALAYARDRHSGNQGDIGRAKRQQQVIEAIRYRLLENNRIVGLIPKAPEIYQQISAGIRTNLTSFQEIFQLAMLALQVDLGNIKKGVIDYSMMIPAKSPTGLDILIPINDKIRELRDTIFSTGGSQAPVASPAANSTLVRDEMARIVIRNGTTVEGLANRTAQYLRDQGMNIVQVENVNQNLSITTIEIYNSKPYSLKFIADLMGVQATNIWNKFDPKIGADIIVYLGNDWAKNNPLPQ